MTEFAAKMDDVLERMREQIRRKGLDTQFEFEFKDGGRLS